jgi:hypothetical protein
MVRRIPTNILKGLDGSNIIQPQGIRRNDRQLRDNIPQRNGAPHGSHLQQVRLNDVSLYSPTWPDLSLMFSPGLNVFQAMAACILQPR